MRRTSTMREDFMGDGDPKSPLWDAVTRSCQFGVVENVIFIRWHRVTRQAMEAVVQTIRQASEDGRKPLVYVAIIPEETQPPDEDGRRALAEAIKPVLGYTTSMHCVIEGTGFKKTMQRSIAAGIFLLSGKRGHMSVHDTVVDALKAAEGLRGPVSSILRRARQEGLIA